MKKIKFAILVLSSIGMATVCSSCEAEDKAMARFDQIDSEIADNSEKIDENATKIDEIINILETPDKDLDQIKSEQLGLSLNKYFDSLARQPEGIEYLNRAKEILLESMQQASTNGVAYGIGSSFGAENQIDGLNFASSEGIFESIARQPEYAEDMLSFCENILINGIYEQESDICSFMIGFSSASIFSSMARQTTIINDLISYGTYTMNAFSNLKNENDAYSLAIASVGFYDAVARQPEIKDVIFEQFKTYTETLIN